MGVSLFSSVPLPQAQQEVQHRLKDMIGLESELVNRDIQITSLRDELSQVKVRVNERDNGAHNSCLSAAPILSI
jgi:hypothetical protein